MKIKLFLGALLVNFCCLAQPQWFSLYFDGSDSSGSVLHIDTMPGGLWQVGKPAKSVFDSAATFPHALMTDTLNPYPINTNSSITFKIANFWTFSGVLALQWMQKIDLEKGKDGGMLEFSTDGGANWENAFHSPYVYNFYGYNTTEVDSINGAQAFSGTDSVWRNIWICFDPFWVSSQTDTLLLRMSLLSDSVDTQQDGWMIDNFVAHMTWVHTISEHQSENLELSPNPTRSRVNIRVKDPGKFHLIEKIELINSRGNVVQSWGKSPSKFFLDIGHHAPGTYFLKVLTAESTEIRQLILEK